MPEPSAPETGEPVATSSGRRSERTPQEACHEGSRRHRASPHRSRSQDRPIPAPGPGRSWSGSRQRALPHRHPRRPRRLAGQADPAVRPGPRGRRHRRGLGDGVTSRAVGDRVAMPWLGHACGHCDYCVSGWETLCEQQQNTGYSIDGGFAEYAVADADYVVPVPDGVAPLDAAPLTCAGVTTYKAVKVAGIRPDRAGRDLRHRRPGPPRRAVRADRRRHRHRRRRRATRSCDLATRARRRPRRQRARRPTRSPRSRQLGGADVAVVLAVMPVGLRAGVRLAAPRRPAGLRGAAAGATGR